MPVNDDTDINLSKIQKDILYGSLLGDGCLTIHKNGVNAQFCYLSKSSQHTNYIGSFFNKLISDAGIKTDSYCDDRTDKIYSRTYFRTNVNTEFTMEYGRWYQDGKKRIPHDLILNPIICLIWYLGDGGLCHLKRTECIKLSTQCFSKEEQERILIPQLSEFEAKLMKADIGSDGTQQYFIYIPRRKIKEFLEYIGNCPFSDYEYKWNMTNYKYKQPKNHTAHEKEFCEMYQSGMTYYAIAKKFNIEPNAVKYYLKKNGLYKNKEKEL